MSLLALKDLCARHRARATGVWRLGKEPVRSVFLDSGDIVFAQSTHQRDRLTNLLVERGKITQAQLDYAMANLKAGLSIGKNLIDMGFITQRDLLEVARAQVERVVGSALGTPDLEPDFEAKELEPNVVRLPFDTPSLLLNGILALQDRERLLEFLGPLNQVVVLEGRRLSDITLPPDLSRLPPLLDGARTLLELSRESGSEPMRVGALALFLREMGWARLHELPPLDRTALDLALAAEPEAMTPPLPLPQEEAPPTLVAAIQAAERPTTNLEHLSESLDRLPEPGGSDADAEEEFLAGEEAPAWNIITGRIEVPTELLDPPPAQDSWTPPAEEEPPLPVQPPEPPASEPLPEAQPPARRRPGLILAALVLLAAGVLGGLWFMRRGRARPASPAEPRPAPAPAPRASEPPVPAVPAPAPANPEPKPEARPETRPEPPPAEKPARPVSITEAARLAALRDGDLETALEQGTRYLRTLPRSDWSLRLEIACQKETLQKAAGLLEGRKADLFLRPLKMRDGRTCYQVFLGHYSSRAAAEKVVPGLPSAFRSDPPRAFQIAEIPE
ncbi:MAG: hypothetical protein HY823_12225 [Acidobacteria bacterium]|nr:hypothetical protein [Acidobacteriota bacterium]